MNSLSEFSGMEDLQGDDVVLDGAACKQSVTHWGLGTAACSHQFAFNISQ